MADQVSITINGVQFQATKGSLLIDKLLDEKIHIPLFQPYTFYNFHLFPTLDDNKR